MKTGVQRILIASVLAAVALWTVWPLLNNTASTLPTVAEYSTALEDNDPAMFCWNLWWTSGWIKCEHPLLFCDILHYPFGISLIRHTLSIGNGVLATPLISLSNPVAALNILLLFHAFLTTIATFLLAQELSVKPWPATLCAMIFTWWPTRLLHATFHLNLAATGWMVLTLFFLIRGIHRQQWVYFFPATVACVFTGACSWHLLTGLFLMLPVCLIPNLSAESRVDSYTQSNEKYFRLCFVTTVVLVTLITLSPLIIPLIQSDPDAPVRDLIEKEKYSIHPISHVRPAVISMIWGDTANTFNSGFPGNVIENTGFIGFGVILAAILVFRSGNKTTRWFLYFGMGFMILSWGPTLHIGSLGIPLPYRILNWLPGIAEGRTPGRFLIHAGLLLGLVCGMQLQQSLKKPALWILFSLMLFLEFLPAPIATITVPEKIMSNSNIQCSGAMLDVPNDWTDRSIMLAQAFHHQPVTTGFCSRMPKSIFQRIQEIPLLSQLSMRPPSVNISDLSDHEYQEQLAQLRQILDIQTIRYDKENVYSLNHLGTITSPAIFMLDRWSGPENWGKDHPHVYWGLWPEARMRIIGFTFPDSVTISGDILAAPQVHNQKIVIEIISNNQTMKTMEISNAQGWSTWKTTIPIPRDQKTPYHDIWFRFSKGTAPREVEPSKSNDTRLLSAALSNVRISR